MSLNTCPLSYGYMDMFLFNDLSMESIKETLVWGICLWCSSANLRQLSYFNWIGLRLVGTITRRQIYFYPYANDINAWIGLCDFGYINMPNKASDPLGNAYGNQGTSATSNNDSYVTMVY